jgi:hypothetical protein
VGQREGKVVTELAKDIVKENFEDVKIDEDFDIEGL